MKLLFKYSLICLVIGLTGCASAPKPFNGEAVAADPWQNANRKVYAFNKALDKVVLSPVTKVYAAITPDPIELAVENFFNNLSEVSHFANHLLQGKPALAANDASRLLINSTVGLFGVIDVASHFGLYPETEDFGQTLGYWGVKSGPYLVLPFFGPSTMRDGASLLADYQLDPLGEYEPVSHRTRLQALQVLDTRNQLQDVQELIIGDEYTFVRDAYLARRDLQIRDGGPAPDDGNDFDEFDEFD